MSESINSGHLFDLDKLMQEKSNLEIVSEKEDFWNDREEALKVIARLNYCRDIIDKYTKIADTCSGLLELLELEDDSLLEEIDSGVESLKKDLKDFEIQVLFTGEFDDHNAIIEIHAGAGGTEDRRDF